MARPPRLCASHRVQRSRLVLAVLVCSSSGVLAAATTPLQQALAAHKAGESATALKHYATFIASSDFDVISATSQASVHSNVGALESARGQTGAAIAAWRRALSIDAAHYQSNLNLAITLPQSDAASAVRYARAAIALRSGAASAHQALANALQNLERGAEAAAAWRAADALASESAAPAPVRRDHCAAAFESASSSGNSSSVAIAAVTTWPLIATRRSHDPPVFVFDALLSGAECASLKALAAPKLQRSYVVGEGGTEGRGGGEETVNTKTTRDSSTAWLEWDCATLLEELRARVCALLGLTRAAFNVRAERLQVVRYDGNAGQQFGLHHDSPTSINRRLLTVLLYLGGDPNAAAPSNGESNGESIEEREAFTDLAGGATCFPALGESSSRSSSRGMSRRTRKVAATAVMRSLERNKWKCANNGTNNGTGALLLIEPRRGSAALFYNLDADGLADPRAIHAGLAPARGRTKWIANVWLAPP